MCAIRHIEKTIANLNCQKSENAKKRKTLGNIYLNGSVFERFSLKFLTHLKLLYYVIFLNSRVFSD